MDVFDSWEKIGTMDVTSRTGISILYIKKVIRKILQNYRFISTETLKFILLILKNRMQETLDTKIGEHQSETIKNRKILPSFYYL